MRTRGGGTVEDRWPGGKQRVEIREQYDGRAKARLTDHVERPRERDAVLEGPLRASLNDRTIRHRVRERHTHLDDVRAGGLYPPKQIDRPRGIRVSSRDVAHEGAATALPQLGKTRRQDVRRSSRRR